jgi:hypothetical protein
MSDQAEPGAFGGATPERANAGDTGFAAHGPGAAHSAAPARGMASAMLAGDDPLITGIYPAHHGRPVSWVAVSIIMAGFVIGGIALIFGPTWWLFWAGLGVAVVGGLLAAAINVFEDWY